MVWSACGSFGPASTSLHKAGEVSIVTQQGTDHEFPRRATDIEAMADAGASAVEIWGRCGTSVLLPEEYRYIAAAAPKRRAEFATGRFCARLALERFALGSAALLVDPDRAPCWPPGILGSITHTDGYCAVVVASEKNLRGVGLDAEIVRSVELALAPQILTDNEMRRLVNRPLATQQISLALAFSAKEAVFKCQFPMTRSWIDFREVEISAERGRFIVNGGSAVNLYPDLSRLI